MNNISRENLLKIKEVPIIEIASQLGIKITRNKSYCFQGHDLNSPSLSFDNKKGLFNCFGCGIAGDSITLVRKCLNLGFQEACEWINKMFHVSTLSRGHGGAYVINQKAGIPKQKLEMYPTSIFAPSPEIYKWLIENTTLSIKSHQYLTSERGFSDNVLKSLFVRDIPQPNLILESLLSTWPKDDLVKCGLIKIVENKRLKLVWWDHVIIFPFIGITGQIEYIQGRRIANNNPKYVNLNGVYSSIYNLNILSKCTFGDEVFICEGVPDTITALQLGLYAVGIQGSNGFKPEWVKHFNDYNINIIPDTDSAGKNFEIKIKAHFRKIGKNVRTIKLPKNTKDLNELFGNQNSRV